MCAFVDPMHEEFNFQSGFVVGHFELGHIEHQRIILQTPVDLCKSVNP